MIVVVEKSNNTVCALQFGSVFVEVSAVVVVLQPPASP